MKVLLAAANPAALGEFLHQAGHEVKEVLVNDLVARIAGEFKPDAVVYIEGISEVVEHEKVLQDLVPSCRVILVSRSTNPLVPYATTLGVRDLVFFPAKPAQILERLEQPANSSEAADMIRGIERSRDSRDKDEGHGKKMGQATPRPELQDKEDGKGKKEYYAKPKGFVGRALGALRNANPKDSEDKPRNKPRISFLRSMLDRGRPHILVLTSDDEELKRIEVSPDSKPDLPDAHTLEALFVPARLGLDTINRLRRDLRCRTVPLIAVGGGEECLRAGADRYVRKVNDKVVKEVRALAGRMRDLWSRAEKDQLTGCYSRMFWDEWLGEQQRAAGAFSVAILDIDHFKAVNDTYGHAAGDAVLSAFGEFLRARIRSNDVVARYGGEEFTIGLPYTGARGAVALMERLRTDWAKCRVPSPSGDISCTFSAGIAEWSDGVDVVKEADRMLYQAKDAGRDRVKADVRLGNRLLILGQAVTPLIPELRANGIAVTADPDDAAVALADLPSFRFAPPGLPLAVLGAGTVADFVVSRERPDAELCTSTADALNHVVKLLSADVTDIKQPEIHVLPGCRTAAKGQTLARHSALYVVCPSRPGLAGDIAAMLVSQIDQAALVCAAPESTGALALGIPAEELAVSDWRVPGAAAPMTWQGKLVWPVDPLKFLDAQESVHALVEGVKRRFPLVVIDCGGSLDLCVRALKDDGVLVLRVSGDVSDRVVSHWLKNYGGPNVLALAPAEVPDLVSADNGFVLVKKAGVVSGR